MKKQHWAIRLRLWLLLPIDCRWNAWVRDITARLERPAIALTFVCSLLAIALPLSSCGRNTVTGPTIVVNVGGRNIPSTVWPVSIEPSTPAPTVTPAPAPLPRPEPPNDPRPGDGSLGPTKPEPPSVDPNPKSQIPSPNPPGSSSCDKNGRGDGNGTPGNGKGRGDERGGCAK